jgi:hypothetical protein
MRHSHIAIVARDAMALDDLRQLVQKRGELLHMAGHRADPDVHCQGAGQVPQASMDWARERLKEPLTVAALNVASFLSRALSRKDAEEAGCQPALA